MKIELYKATASKTYNDFDKIYEMIGRDLLLGQYYVAVNGDTGEIIGCQCLCRINWFLSEIAHLYVKPSFRNKGVANFLIRKVTKRAETPVVICTIVSNNLPSIRLHENLGFKSTHEFKNENTGNMVKVFEALKTKIKPIPAKQPTSTFSLFEWITSKMKKTKGEKYGSMDNL